MVDRVGVRFRESRGVEKSDKEKVDLETKGALCVIESSMIKLWNLNILISKDRGDES